MKTPDQERIQQLLRRVLPPIGDAAAEPSHDLWPDLLRRVDAPPAAPPWFDWALAGGVLIFTLCLPASIPVFLYYL